MIKDVEQPFLNFVNFIVFSDFLGKAGPAVKNMNFVKYIPKSKLLLRNTVHLDFVLNFYE